MVSLLKSILITVSIFQELEFINFRFFLNLGPVDLCHESSKAILSKNTRNIRQLILVLFCSVCVNPDSVIMSPR